MAVGRAKFRKRLTGAALAALVLAAGPAGAQTAATAADIKAAYLLKFGAFVDWPPRADAASAPLVLCLVGKDAVTVAIGRQAEGAKVGARAVTLRRLQTLTAASGCDIAYMARSGDQPAAESLRAVATTPVLTVTDADHGDARGMLHFAMQQSRVKFHIDAGAAARSGLTLSSKLLALALSVKP